MFPENVYLPFLGLIIQFYQISLAKYFCLILFNVEHQQVDRNHITLLYCVSKGFLKSRFLLLEENYLLVVPFLFFFLRRLPIIFIFCVLAAYLSLSLLFLSSHTRKKKSHGSWHLSVLRTVDTFAAESH